MDIVVTGCAGFIGSHFVEKMLNDGHNIVGIDNLAGNNNAFPKKENLRRLSEFEDFKFFNCDILRYEQIEEIFSSHSFDKMVHLAAKTGVRESVIKPIEYYNNNISGTLVLLDLCSRYGLKDFIFGSSSSVYGDHKVPLEENMECNPISPYGLSKRTCEIYGKNFSELHEINFVSLRFFTVYGPRQRKGMAISNFVNGILKNERIQVFGDGTSARDYTYVDDITMGISLALKKSFSFEILNIGNSEAISLQNLIKIIEDETKIQANIKYEEKQQGDVYYTQANITKASNLLGYQPQNSIEQGIKKYIRWIEELI